MIYNCQRPSSLSSWIAAGTSYSHSDQPMIPFYIFYSMFGFQRVQLLGSGSILLQVLAASRLLSDEFGVSADVWSITSFTELQKDGLRCDRWNLLHPEEEQHMPFVTLQLQESEGPIVAATDYLRAYPDLIRGWIPNNRRYKVLGTDGFGCSDSRNVLRDFFEIDARYIALAALRSLVDEGQLEPGKLIKAIEQMEIDPAKPNPLGNSGGYDEHGI